MNAMKKSLFVLLLLVLSACAANGPGSERQDGSPPFSQGFPFEAYGQEMYVCAPAKPVLENLPEPRGRFESPSCAFDGLDITYFYPGFELTTYPENGEEHILSVVLTDDSVSAPGGVTIGGSLSSMEKAYGTDYTQKGWQYTYASGKGSLVFTFKDGVIIGIVFAYAAGVAAER